MVCDNLLYCLGLGTENVDVGSEFPRNPDAVRNWDPHWLTPLNNSLIKLFKALAIAARDLF